MRPVLINGLGCFESGARVVLRELVRTFPAGRSAVLVMPACNRADAADFGPNIKVIALSHAWFGRWLRPLYEAAVFILGWCGVFSRIVNLSHYGWCPGGAYTLYFHNQLLVEDGNNIWSGQGGRPNRFKRWCLHTCFRQAETIVVQTEHMAEKVRDYASARRLQLRPIEIVEPLPAFPASARTIPKAHTVQFFYPTSVFAHKRPELAASAVIEANKTDPRIGLVLTTQPLPGLISPCITYLGTISREEVLAHFVVSDALLFTSSYETLGLPLLEAMHFGLPAVLPDKSYARAIYAEAGVYYENETTEEVCAAILRSVREKQNLAERVTLRRPHVWAARTSWTEHWAKFGVETTA